MKRKLKNQNGAVTVFVVVAMLFFVLFILTTYTMISRRHQVQAETLNEFVEVYGGKTSEERYNSYFETGAVFIYTEDQLKKVGSGEMVQVAEQNGKIFEFSNTATYVLMNDIYLSDSTIENGSNFTPIESFKGMFDGMGYTVHNMQINLEDTIEVGMFKSLQGGYVCNLNLENANIVGRRKIGGFAGVTSLGAVIENCSFDGNIEAKYGETITKEDGTETVELDTENGAEISSSNVAGIAGFCASPNDQIISCVNNGTIVGLKNQVAGIVAATYGKVTNNVNYGRVSTQGGYTGGICGWLTSSGVMYNCTNYNDVTSSGNYTGGIVGSNSGTIENSNNIGKITGASYIGGIAGYSNNNVIGCSNKGEIIGDFVIGGIIGFANTSADENIKIDNCNNVIGGKITATSKNVGGIIGAAQHVNISNCINLETIDSEGGVAGGITGYITYGSINSCTNNGNILAVAADSHGGICGWVGPESSVSTCINYGEVTLEGTAESAKLRRNSRSFCK